MGQFLEIHKESKLTQDETVNLNSPRSIKPVKCIIKNAPQKKSLGQDCFTGKLYQTYNKIKCTQSLPGHRGRKMSQLVL